MDPPVTEPLSVEALVAELLALRKEVAELRRKLVAAEAEIESLKRSGKRQATPFSKGERVARPKTPGRKKGQGGRFCRRLAPPPDSYTREVSVPVTQPCCPRCAGPLSPDRTETVTTTELPAFVPLDVYAFHLATSRCRTCRHRVWATHPEVPPDQRGATAHRVGQRVMSACHLMHYHLGVPVRKVPFILETLFDLSITQGAITQDALRRARANLGEAYQELRRTIAREAVVCTDDTGWKVAGAPAFLMGFFSPMTSLFQIRARHRNEEVREVIPGDFRGTLSTDRGVSYDALELRGVRQQKCLGHIQRDLAEALENQWGRGRSFCLRLRKLLRSAVTLWTAYRTGNAPDWETERTRIIQAVDDHLRDRPMADPVNRRLLKELGGHHRRRNLLRFLEDPRVEPTNNRAERGLRPAVIARKVSHCSKTWDGAHAHAVFASLLSTLHLRGSPKSPGSGLIDSMAAVFRTGRLPDGR